MIKSSQQILLMPVLVTEPYCVCMALHSIPEEQLSWVCKALVPLKSQTDPPEEGVGLLIQAECSIGVPVPGPRPGYCFQTMTLFRAALHASQRTGSQCLVVWLMHEGLCLPPVCSKLKNSICFPLCVSGTAVLIKFVQIKG